MNERVGGWRGAITVLGISALAACGGPDSQGQLVQINGVGATFPNPIYSKWFSEYGAIHPNVRINYQPHGSGAGIQQLRNRTAFFGASDSPMTDEQLAAAPGPILQLPTVIGSVVPAYNLSGVTTELRFTGPLLADIFLGNVTRWNDPAIAAVNPGVTLPARDITVVRRSDSSGTTFVWADYLAKVSPEWKTRVGVSTALNWPVGVGGKGSEGVSGLVKLTDGSIGYMEAVYAAQNQIPFGAVQNATGAFVKSSIEAATAAAAGAVPTIPDDFRVSITNAPGEDAYPIASFTWMLFYENPEDTTQARVMVDFMKWALTDGQRFAAELGYSPLPEAVIEKELRALERIRIQ